MRKVGPDGSVPSFSSWAFVALKTLTSWTSAYSLLGDRRHCTMSCSRSLDPDTFDLLCIRKIDLLEDASLDAR